VGRDFSSFNNKNAINNHYKKIVLDTETPEIYFDWGSMLIAFAKINNDEAAYMDL